MSVRCPQRVQGNCPGRYLRPSSTSVLLKIGAACPPMAPKGALAPSLRSGPVPPDGPQGRTRALFKIGAACPPMAPKGALAPGLRSGGVPPDGPQGRTRALFKIGGVPPDGLRPPRLRAGFTLAWMRGLVNAFRHARRFESASRAGSRAFWSLRKQAPLVRQFGVRGCRIVKLALDEITFPKGSLTRSSLGAFILA
jgi:hypothetical protein